MITCDRPMASQLYTQCYIAKVSRLFAIKIFLLPTKMSLVGFRKFVSYDFMKKYLIKRCSVVHFFWQTSTFRRVVNRILNVSSHSFKWFIFHLNRVKFCEFDYIVKSWHEFITVFGRHASFDCSSDDTVTVDCFPIEALKLNGPLNA